MLFTRTAAAGKRAGGAIAGLGEDAAQHHGERLEMNSRIARVRMSFFYLPFDMPVTSVSGKNPRTCCA